MYLPQPENAAQWFTPEYTKCMLRDAWLEDGSTLEATQLSDQEIAIRHGRKVIEDFVRSGERGAP